MDSISEYVVKAGDTLCDIAEKYLGSGSKYTQLAAINGLSNPDLIYVGQVLKLDNTGGGGGSATTSGGSTKASIKQFGIQSNTENTIFATWDWSRSNTENYETEWTYDTGDCVWFIGSKSSTEDKQSTYSIPSNAKHVRFRVKPVSKTYTSNNKTTSYWTASWSTYEIYSTNDLPPVTPSTPNVEIDKYKLTARIDNISVDKVHATGVQFQVIKDDKTLFTTGKASINTTGNYVSYSCTVTAGSNYKVRCRSYKGSEYSNWSEYSANVQTIPAVPAGITTCRASSDTSIYLEWSTVNSAESYDIEYATQKDYFDRTDKTTTKSGITFAYYELIGLETGQEYFFRVRAVNAKGQSAWSGIKSVTIGKDPAPPTTWSSTTTVITGEKLVLYWVHNSEDNSSQTYAELEVYINELKELYTIKNSTDEETKDKTSFYEIDTTSYSEGVTIRWRVRTAGITKVYGDWSTQRTVDVYAPPTMDMSVTDSSDATFETLESFPFKIYAIAGPNTQVPIGYNLTISANDIYDTVDHVGNPKTVNKGEHVYSRYFDISTPLSLTLSAGDLDLENNISYTISCIASMDSGLTAEASFVFDVAWVDETYAPNAEINLDRDTLVANIRPYCEKVTSSYHVVTNLYNLYTVTDTVLSGVFGYKVDNTFTTTGEQVYYGTTADGESTYYCEVIDGELVDGAKLSVYRREFDGTFTEIATGIDNMTNTFVTDPHPALDYARYRIVATTDSTGAVSYYDIPGYPVGEKAAIIQWDEEWSNFDVTNEDELEQPPWAGSLLKLPYNLDVSDKHKNDVSLVEYIGRKHPVSYYGTQVGESQTWSLVIDKKDEDTLYALRRLAIWMGNVYVREPSGSGYWASISVSFSQKHRDLTIPVSIEITRVEGGA